MKNLTTRKIVFGMLMALVLAFSVQGIVDAQSVSVSGDGATTSSDSGIQVIASPHTPAAIERSFTIQVNGAEDDENVTILPTAGMVPAVVTKIEVTSAPTNGTPAKGEAGLSNTITFRGLGNDTNNNPITGNWTIKITYTVDDFGGYEVSVGGTVDSDVAGSPVRAYVVRSDEQSRRANGGTGREINPAASTPQTPSVRASSINVKIANSTEAWTKVNFTISGGQLYLSGGGQYLQSNRLYTVSGSEKYFSSLSVFTIGGTATANIRINPNQTAKITASIPGSPSAKATYIVTSFFDDITLERVSGNYQHDYGGEYLDAPLVVRVSDGPIDRRRGVSGQKVTFTLAGSGTDGDLRPASGTKEIGDNRNTVGHTIDVETNSSGEARVILQLPRTAGLYTVEAQVGTVRLTNDYPGGEFKVFTVRDPNSTLVIEKTDISTTKTPVEQVVRDQDITVKVNQPWTEVEFSITGGQLYLRPELLDLPWDRPRLVNTLSVSSADTDELAIVRSRVTSAAARVSVRIIGSGHQNARYDIDYFAGNIRLEAVSGDQPYEGGAPGGLREDPFVVRVLAGNSSVSGQVIKFSHTAVGGDSTLVPVPGTSVFVATRGSITLAGADNTITNIPVSSSVLEPVKSERLADYGFTNSNMMFTQTDSNGEAKVYLQMGSGVSADHTVTATIQVGTFTDTESFTVKSLTSDVPARLMKIDVDAESSDDDRETLAVRVENLNGDRLPVVNVRFTTTHGTIIRKRGTISDRDAAENPSTPITSGQEIFVLTNSFGEVWVTYVEDPDVSGQTVRAEIASEQGDQEYDFEVSHVTFDIDGGGRSTNTRTGTTTVNPYLSISLTGSNRNPGEFSSLTVVAYGADRQADPNVPVSLSATGITFPSTVSTGQSVSFLIPSSSTTITATDLGRTYRSASATLNITSQPARLVTVSGTGQSGAVGAQLSSDFVVRVEDRNGRALNNESVTFASDCWWRKPLSNKCFDKFKRGGADSTHLRKFPRHEYR